MNPGDITTIAALSGVIRIPRAGFLRLGEPMEGRGYPQKIDYFRPEIDDARIYGEFVKRYGDRPKSLPVVFPHPDRRHVFPCSFSAYRGSKEAPDKGKKRRGVLICKGNGLEAVRRNDKTQDWDEIECPGSDECSLYAERKCRRLGRLSVLPYELPTLLTLQVNTSSVNSIININTAFDELMLIKGRIDFIKVLLQVVPMTTTFYDDAGGGIFKPTTIFVLRVDIAKSLEQLVAERAIVSIEGRQTLELEPPSEEAPADLYPPAVIEEPVAKPVPEPSHVDERERLITVAGLTGVVAEALRAAPVQAAIEALKRRLANGIETGKQQPLADKIDDLGMSRASGVVPGAAAQPQQQAPADVNPPVHTSATGATPKAPADVRRTRKPTTKPIASGSAQPAAPEKNPFETGTTGPEKPYLF